MKWLLVFALTFAFPLLLCADVVELTTGEKLEGKVISRDESGVTLKVPYGLIIIEDKFVKSVTEGDQKSDDEKAEEYAEHRYLDAVHGLENHCGAKQDEEGAPEEAGQEEGGFHWHSQQEEIRIPKLEIRRNRCCL